MNGSSKYLEILLDYIDEEARNWEQFFRRNPEALKARVDIAHVEDARGFLHHIFAVEHRYAQRLNEEPNTPFAQIPQEPLDELFRVGHEARARLHRFIAEADDHKMQQTVTFKTVSYGEQTVTFRKCLMHSLVHSIRHWAQMATAMRQAGFKQDWQHDFLFSKATE